MKKILISIMMFFGLVFTVVGCGKGPDLKTVSFETFGGSAIEAVKVENNTIIEKPADPTKEGFSFAGWFVDEELNEEFDFSSPITKSTTLYAKFNQIEINISFKDEISDSYNVVKPEGKIYYGENYRFTVFVENAFNQSDASVYASMGGVLVDKISSNIVVSGTNAGKRQVVFEIKNVKANGTIIIGGIKPNSYSINLPSTNQQVGYEIKANKSSVIYNKEYTLTLKIDENYNQSVDRFIVYINKGLPSEKVYNSDNAIFNEQTNEYSLTVKDVVVAQNITVEGIEINKFAVEDLSNLSNEELFTVKWIEGVENNQAVIGSTIKFEIQIHEFYDRSDINISCEMGGELINLSEASRNGNVRIYEIENVSGDVSNFIFDESSFVKNVYNITLPQDVEGYKVGINSINNKMVAGSKLEITITAVSGYNYENAKVEFLNESVSLSGLVSKKTIVVDPVKSDIEINVLGVEPILFDVLVADLPNNVQGLTSVEGLYSEGKVLKTSNYSFELQFEEGYELGTIKVFNNNVELVSEIGVYSIENVSQNINISFSGEASLKEYSVEFEENEFVLNVSGRSSLTHGESGEYSFEIPEYCSNSISSMKIYINDLELSKSEFNINNRICLINIENIKEDVVVRVENLKKNSVQITCTNFEEICSDYYLIEDGERVEFGNAEVETDYYLIIALNYAYEQSYENIYLIVDGNNIEARNVYRDYDINATVCSFELDRFVEESSVIEVAGHEKNTYYIEKQDNEYSSFYYFTITILTQLENNRIEHGENVKFKIDLINEHYKISTSNMLELPDIEDSNWYESIEYDEQSGEYTIKNIQGALVISADTRLIEIKKYNLDLCLEKGGEPFEKFEINSGNKFEYVYDNGLIRVDKWSSEDVDLTCVTKDGTVYPASIEEIKYSLDVYYDNNVQNLSIGYSSCELHDDGFYYYHVGELEDRAGLTFAGWKCFVNGEVDKEFETIGAIKLIDMAEKNYELYALWNVKTPVIQETYQKASQIGFRVGYVDGEFSGSANTEYEWRLCNQDGISVEQIPGISSFYLNYTQIGLEKGTYYIICKARVKCGVSYSEYVVSEVFEVTIN